MIRGAIFDLDGVLLDSMAIWNDLGARYLRRQGIAPEAGLNAILFSMSMEQGATYLKGHYPLNGSEAEILNGIQDMLRDFYYDEVPAKAGAGETLALLQGHGIPMAAATSSPRGHVTHALDRLGTAKAAGYRTVGLYDADGEADQEGLQTAAEIYLMTLQDFPAAWERLNRT